MSSVDSQSTETVESSENFNDTMENTGLSTFEISPSLDPLTLARKEVRPHREVMQIARRSLIRQMMQTSLLQADLAKPRNELNPESTTTDSSIVAPIDSKDPETTSLLPAEIKPPSTSLNGQKDNIPSPIRKGPAAKAPSTSLNVQKDNIPSPIRKRPAAKAPSTSLNDQKDNIPSPIRKRPAAKSFLAMTHRKLVTTRCKPTLKAPTQKKNNNKPQKKMSPPPSKKERPKKKEKAVKASQPKDKLIFEGKPDDQLDGGWPEGWIKRIYERQSGATKGRGDRYWYTPKQNFKLRSLKEVKRFLKALTKTDGDEVEAKKIFQNINI